MTILNVLDGLAAFFAGRLKASASRTPIQPNALILKLPNEVILEISSYLYLWDKAALLRTCRRIHDVVGCDLYTDIDILPTKAPCIHQLMRILFLRRDLAARIRSFDAYIFPHQYQGIGTHPREASSQNSRRNRANRRGGNSKGQSNSRRELDYESLNLYLPAVLASTFDYTPKLRSLRLHDLDWRWASHRRLATKALSLITLVTVVIDGSFGSEEFRTGSICTLLAGDISTIRPWGNMLTPWSNNTTSSIPAAIPDEVATSPHTRRRIVFDMWCLVFHSIWSDLSVSISHVDELVIRVQLVGEDLLTASLEPMVEQFKSIRTLTLYGLRIFDINTVIHVLPSLPSLQILQVELAHLGPDDSTSDICARFRDASPDLQQIVVRNI